MGKRHLPTPLPYRLRFKPYEEFKDTRDYKIYGDWGIPRAHVITMTEDQTPYEAVAASERIDIGRVYHIAKPGKKTDGWWWPEYMFTLVPTEGIEKTMESWF